jgi:hypothetical protein
MNKCPLYSPINYLPSMKFSVYFEYQVLHIEFLMVNDTILNIVYWKDLGQTFEMNRLFVLCYRFWLRLILIFNRKFNKRVLWFICSFISRSKILFHFHSSLTIFFVFRQTIFFSSLLLVFYSFLITVVFRLNYQRLSMQRRRNHETMRFDLLVTEIEHNIF